MILTREPALDAQRALHIAAFVALIDLELRASGGLAPVGAANWLVRRLMTSGLASVDQSGDHSGDMTVLTLCGIRASCNGTSYGLLRNWQSAARNRLAEEVRK